jgi:uncharacterized protein with PIN domain/mRNA deadenylase 3'-5' endonuclease subunit Ccr4
VIESAAADAGSGRGSGPPTVLCLQELDEFAAQYREPLARLGYDCAYAPRCGSNQCPPSSSSEEWSPDEWAAGCRTSAKRHKHDGVLIAWQREQLQLADEESVHRVDFDDLAYAPVELHEASVAASAAAGVDAGSCSGAVLPDTRLLRHNAGMFVFLVPRTSAAQITPANGTRPALKPLLVACTHLYWSPLHEDVKQRQLHYLLARMRAECARRINLDSSGRRQGASGDVDKLSHQMQASRLGTAPARMPSSSSSSFAADPLSAFPLLLCGDLNSTPMSGVYRLITEGRAELSASTAPHGAGSSSAAVPAAAEPVAPALAPSPADVFPRFLVDTDLIKVAKWLRSIGVDCAHMSEAERLASGGVARSHERMFERAIKERRIILTRSAKLTERRGCPTFYLLRPQQDLESAFALVVQHFGLQFREDLFYSRCIFCNSLFTIIHAAYFIGGTDPDGVEHLPHDPPPDLPRGFVLRGYHDEQGRLLTFQRCQGSDPWNACAKLYWWGERSSEAVRMFQDKFENLQKQHDEEAEAAAAYKAVTVAAPSSSATVAAGAASALSSPLGHTHDLKEPSAPVRRHYTAARLAQLRLAARIAMPDLSSTSAPSSPPRSPSPPPFAAPAGGVAAGSAVDPAMRWIGRGVRLRSAYALIEGRDPPFTNVTATFADCLDYVFVSPDDANERRGEKCSGGGSGTLRVQSVRPVTKGAALDVDQLRRDGGAGGGCCSSMEPSVRPASLPPSKGKSKSKAQSKRLEAAAAASAVVHSTRLDAAWRPSVPLGHTPFTWGLMGQPPEARVASAADHVAAAAQQTTNIDHSVVSATATSLAAVEADSSLLAVTAAAASSANAASVNSTLNPTVQLGKAAAPLSTVLPNLSWPSDHLLLMANCVWTL